MKKAFGIILVYLMPVLAFAQGTNPTPTPGPLCPLDFSSLRQILLTPTCVINHYIVPTLIGGIIATFMYGIVQYIYKSDSTDARKKMKEFIAWTILALFVVLSLWGIINLVGNTLQLGQ